LEVGETAHFTLKKGFDFEAKVTWVKGDSLAIDDKIWSAANRPEITKTRDQVRYALQDFDRIEIVPSTGPKARVLLFLVLAAVVVALIVTVSGGVELGS